MTKFEIACKVEDLSFGLWSLSGLALAVEDAMFHGTWATKEYEGAMFALVKSVQTLEKESRQVVDEIYEAAWEEKQ